MNNAIPNYFFVNRDLLSSDRWLAEPFTRGQAWIDLFGLAQFEKGFFRVRGIKVDVERGQLAYSQITLAKRWRWSRDKVRRYLKELEINGDIIQQNNEVTTLITIVKYNIWQGEVIQQTIQQPIQQKNIKQYTYNKDNNVNNDNNTTARPDNKLSPIVSTPRPTTPTAHRPQHGECKDIDGVFCKYEIDRWVDMATKKPI